MQARQMKGLKYKTWFLIFLLPALLYIPFSYIFTNCYEYIQIKPPVLNLENTGNSFYPKNILLQNIRQIK